MGNFVQFINTVVMVLMATLINYNYIRNYLLIKQKKKQIKTTLPVQRFCIKKKLDLWLHVEITFAI